MNVQRKKLIVLFTIVTILFASCAPEADVELGYQPPIVPVRISVNSHGRVSAGFSSKVVTPIGTFDIGGSVSVNALRNKYSNKVLIVRVDDTATVYELEEGKHFNVTFDDSNTLYKEVSLDYESNGDIVLELVSVSGNASSNGDSSSSGNGSELNNGYWCDDLDGVKLNVGEKAKVAWPKVNLRSYPEVPQDFYANIVVEVEENTRVTIIGGPECAHEGTWWEIRTEYGDTGWMREFVSDGYLLK